jgi:serine/threonine protein kinase
VYIDQRSNDKSGRVRLHRVAYVRCTVFPRISDRTLRHPPPIEHECAPVDRCSAASRASSAVTLVVVVRMEHYSIIRKVGAGTFGVVFLARHLPSSALVALKLIRIKNIGEGMPKVLLREIQALEKLAAEREAKKSRHVLTLREYFAHGAAVVLVLEYMTADLQMVLKSGATLGAKLHPRHIKAIMWMCVCGVSTLGCRRNRAKIGRCSFLAEDAHTLAADASARCCCVASPPSRQIAGVHEQRVMHRVSEATYSSTSCTAQCASKNEAVE